MLENRNSFRIDLLSIRVFFYCRQSNRKLLEPTANALQRHPMRTGSGRSSEPSSAEQASSSGTPSQVSAVRGRSAA